MILVRCDVCDREAPAQVMRADDYIRGSGLSGGTTIITLPPEYVRSSDAQQGYAVEHACGRCSRKAINSIIERARESGK